MLTEKFLQGRLRHDLSEEETSALESVVTRTVTLGPRDILAERGTRLERSYYIVKGTMLRHIDDKQGERQLVGINILGDFVDLHAFAMKRLDHSVSALDTCTLAEVPHASIAQIMERMPHLARSLWFSTLLDAAMHREWIYRLGRLNAEGRIAHLICELLERLRFVDAWEGGKFPIPLLQRDYAEACGISAVHANRSIRSLRERGALDPRGDGLIEILDEGILRMVSGFTPDYLYGLGNLAISSLSDK